MTSEIDKLAGEKARIKAELARLERQKPSFISVFVKVMSHMQSNQTEQIASENLQNWPSRDELVDFAKRVKKLKSRSAELKQMLDVKLRHL